MHDDLRLAALTRWLEQLPAGLALDLSSLTPASSDASFRRYFRIRTLQDQSLIVMDAPPDKEDCQTFLDVARLLDQARVTVPRRIAEDAGQGFLVLSDLGTHTYYQILQTGASDARIHRLYLDALDALIKVQRADASSLPVYDAARMREELGLFGQWYAAMHCQSPLTDQENQQLDTVFSELVNTLAKQPQVFVHRDFHSPNLMATHYPDGADFGPNPGVIDFQDAVRGPLTYDLASLLLDARTTWDEAQQLDWAIRYWEMAKAADLPVPPDFADFHVAYEWMSLQRNLRILGVFARLSHRDGKHHYLDHIPRVSAYVRQVASRYGQFNALLRVLNRIEKVEYGFSF